ncbi:MAG: magnesium protoporphyrin IX methyltransferase [Pseudomonadota bacterium]
MAGYETTRGRLEAYFDDTAHEAWRRLMSDAPVSRIRATVRAGRDEMRAALLSRLPKDMEGRRVLDAGCGAGQMAQALAARGATVLAIDISPKLLEMAAETTPAALKSQIQYVAGDMLEAGGGFDHVVAMDSLIHYEARDAEAALVKLAAQTEESMVFTLAPATLPLRAMHVIGKAFPKGDRSPAIVPVAPYPFATRLTAALPEPWDIQVRTRVARGFYISQAMEAAR